MKLLNGFNPQFFMLFEGLPLFFKCKVWLKFNHFQKIVGHQGFVFSWMLNFTGKQFNIKTRTLELELDQCFCKDLKGDHKTIVRGHDILMNSSSLK